MGSGLGLKSLESTVDGGNPAHHLSPQSSAIPFLGLYRVVQDFVHPQ